MTWKATVNSIIKNDKGENEVAVTYTDGRATMTDVLAFDERVLRPSIEATIADRVALLEGMTNEIGTDLMRLEGAEVGPATGAVKAG